MIERFSNVVMSDLCKKSVEDLTKAVTRMTDLIPAADQKVAIILTSTTLLAQGLANSFVGDLGMTRENAAYAICHHIHKQIMEGDK